jgi:hypothetical protein
MFDLETAIARWRKRMGADPGLEPGFVAEIESHLRDKIDALVGEGRNPEEAFQEAARALGESALVGSDFTKVYAARRSGRPSWKAPRFIPALFWNYLRTTSRFLRRHRGLRRPQHRRSRRGNALLPLDHGLGAERAEL